MALKRIILAGSIEHNWTNHLINLYSLRESFEIEGSSNFNKLEYDPEKFKNVCNRGLHYIFCFESLMPNPITLVEDLKILRSMFPAQVLKERLVILFVQKTDFKKGLNETRRKFVSSLNYVFKLLDINCLNERNTFAENNIWQLDSYIELDRFLKRIACDFKEIYYPQFFAFPQLAIKATNPETNNNLNPYYIDKPNTSKNTLRNLTNEQDLVRFNRPSELISSNNDFDEIRNDLNYEPNETSLRFFLKDSYSKLHKELIIKQLEKVSNGVVYGEILECDECTCDHPVLKKSSDRSFLCTCNRLDLNIEYSNRASEQPILSKITALKITNTKELEKYDLEIRKSQASSHLIKTNQSRLNFLQPDQGFYKHSNSLDNLNGLINARNGAIGPNNAAPLHLNVIPNLPSNMPEKAVCDENSCQLKKTQNPPLSVPEKTRIPHIISSYIRIVRSEQNSNIYQCLICPNYKEINCPDNLNKELVDHFANDHHLRDELYNSI